MNRDVVSEIHGRAGIITLNRPGAINALTYDMVLMLSHQLREWASDDQVDLVILRGAGEKGLCAGGDIATLYHDARSGGLAGVAFWKAEYELNHYISEYPKPYVALMTGIVLGGGIGVSAHASHRVVTDTSRIGMPEVGIGYSPDAGGSYLLTRAPDRLGYHLAYTALHVGAAEALDLGLADYFVPQDQLEPLIEALAASGDASEVDAFARQLEPGFGEDRAEMVEVYAAPTAPETLEKLESCNSAWATKAAAAMRRNSPLGIRVTEQSLGRSRDASLAEALTQEFWMSLNLQRHREFAEGIRAQIIDKDRDPDWTYKELADVPSGVVDSIFNVIHGTVPPHFEKKGKP